MSCVARQPKVIAEAMLRWRYSKHDACQSDKCLIRGESMNARDTRLIARAENLPRR
jgi:hypothetical protein